MKKTITLLSLLILANANMNAQQNKANENKPANTCEALKKENDSLKKALELNEPMTTFSHNDVEYKVIKVFGDKKSQTVSVEIIVTNKLANRNFEMNNMMGTSIKITTITGEVLFSNEMYVPGVSSYAASTILHTDVPLKMTFNFNPLLSSNEYIKLFYLSYKLRNLQDSKKDNTEEIEFKDLKITWK
jgi:hypothetical protein